MLFYYPGFMFHMVAGSMVWCSEALGIVTDEGVWATVGHSAVDSLRAHIAFGPYGMGNSSMQIERACTLIGRFR